MLEINPPEITEFVLDPARAYQILPKSLAVSLCRAYEKKAASEDALEVFGGVVWTLQRWSE